MKNTEHKTSGGLKPLNHRLLADKNSDRLLFIPMSGVEEIGMNFYAYGYQGKWLLIDFGMGFAGESRGLHGIDLIFPSPQFFAKQKENIVGLLLTHAHEDHIGAIPYLWPELNCPIYGTPFTLGVVREKLRECSFGRRVPLKPFHKDQVITIGPFTITPYCMTHSILEQQAFCIEVGAADKKTSVLHTGDWKIDRDPLLGALTDEVGLKALGNGASDNLENKKIAAVISDSTNVFNNHPSLTEGAVLQGMIETFQKIEAGDYRIDDSPLGMIIVTCFASNLQRVLAIATAAEKIGRRVAVVGRAFERYLKVAEDTGYWSQFPKTLQQALSEKDIRRTRRDKLVVIATGSQGETRGAVARIARFEHGVIKPIAGDYMLFSSRVIPGNEVAVAEIKNNLVRAGVRLMDIADSVDNKILHASGHPTRDDLKQLYSWLKPKSLIPVHGEPRHLVEHINLAKKECGIDQAIAPYNGVVIEIGRHPQQPLKIIGHVAAGHLVKDGHDILPIEDKALAVRRKLAAAGNLTISASFKGGQLAEYKWSMLGLSLSLEQEKQMGSIISRALATVPRQKHKGHHRQASSGLEEELNKALKRHFRKNFDKSPAVTIHFLEM
ncbi:MAG: ribonuclease J [Hydrotalea sp.]|nr:ribonuclease J [Hydrotalea sp.]